MEASKQKQETLVHLSYTKGDLEKQIVEDLKKKGYVIRAKGWNEKGSAYDVSAIKPEKTK